MQYISNMTADDRLYESIKRHTLLVNDESFAKCLFSIPFVVDHYTNNIVFAKDAQLLNTLTNEAYLFEENEEISLADFIDLIQHLKG